MGNYPELIAKAQNSRIHITKAQRKEIAAMYQQIADDFNHQLKKQSDKTLTYRWVKDYEKTLQTESKYLFSEINSVITKSILKTGKAVIDAEEQFYSSLCLEISDKFSDVFSNIPQKVANELMNGGIYKDFSGLSERIWAYRARYNKDIGQMMQQGILQQKSAMELAKDLHLYLNPKAAKPWNWNAVYPGVNHVVDYNTQRLARTSVTHAYQLAFQRATKDNPFVEEYEWLSSNGGRTCELCMQRNGQRYSKNNVPLDHSNGMCTIVAVIRKNSKEIAQELREWVNGQSNLKLDKWLTPINKSTILTPNDIYALNYYKSAKSFQLNYNLRTSRPLTQDQMEMILQIDLALDRLPEYRGTVFRSLSLGDIDDLDAFQNHHQPGEVISYPAYTSTGTSVYDSAMEIQLIIQSYTGRDMRQYNPNEHEVLFKRGTRFFVVKREGNKIWMIEKLR